MRRRRRRRRCRRSPLRLVERGGWRKKPSWKEEKGGRPPPADVPRRRVFVMLHTRSKILPLKSPGKRVKRRVRGSRMCTNEICCSYTPNRLGVPHTQKEEHQTIGAKMRSVTQRTTNPSIHRLSPTQSRMLPCTYGVPPS